MTQKRPLIITMMLVLLISTVCSTAVVSAAPQKSIYVYTDADKTNMHPCPNGILRPFTYYYTYTDGGTATAAGSALTTSTSASGKWQSATAILGSLLYTPNYEQLKDKEITLTVKVNYICSMDGGTGTDSLNEIIVSSTPAGTWEMVVRQVSDGVVSGTATVVVTTDYYDGPLTVGDLCYPDGQFKPINVEAVSKAYDGAACSITADVIQMQLDFV